MQISLISGSVLLLFGQLLSAQTETSQHDSDSTQCDQTPVKVFYLWRDAHVSGGQLTLPFKIRKQTENSTFRLTTDVTVGGFIGYTRCLSQEKDCFITLPFTAGLTFINVSDNNTSLDRDAADAEVVPGLSWCTGLILQIERYNLGLMMGKDYASSIGDQWEYHGKMWWSFGVGFTFIQ